MAELKLPDKLPSPQATLRRWLVQPGQAFAMGATLAELELEEALIHLFAQQPGAVGKALVSPGQTVAAGATLALLTTSEGGGTVTASTGHTSSVVHQQTNSSAGKDKPMTQSSAGSATPILMPQAGNTMEEGRVLAWKVKEGDTITVGQVICEIETDKATMEFESPIAGKLAKIVVPEGEAAPVKTPIAFVGEGDISNIGFRISNLENNPAATNQSTPAAADTQTTTSENSNSEIRNSKFDGRPKISPAARVIAAQQNLDPAALAAVGNGSGPGGRILSSDVAGLASRLTTQATSQTRPHPNVSAASTPTLPEGEGTKAKPPSAITSTPWVDGITRRPMSKMRRAIGLNLQQSKQTVPHFYVRQTIDAQPLISYQKAMKQLAGCSINDCILYLLARTMKSFPAFRSRLEGDTIVEYAAVNLGVAVGIDDGLVVPVLMNADTRSLADLSAETKRIIESARKGKLENLGKTSFTVSNLGMFGIEEFAAIINPPEAGILAVSAAREGVLVKGGALRAGQVMTLTISADHRIVDGMLAAQFMAAFKLNLENPGNVA